MKHKEKENDLSSYIFPNLARFSVHFGEIISYRSCNPGLLAFFKRAHWPLPVLVFVCVLDLFCFSSFAFKIILYFFVYKREKIN